MVLRMIQNVPEQGGGQNRGGQLNVSGCDALPSGHLSCSINSWLGTIARPLLQTVQVPSQDCSSVIARLFLLQRSSDDFIHKKDSLAKPESERQAFN